MTVIHVVTKNGTLVETIDPTGYDLHKSFARQALLEEVITAVKKAGHLEEAE